MSNATNTTKASVLVGCRFPAGLVLRLHKMVETTEVMPGGRTQKIKVAAQIPGAAVRLKGAQNRESPVAVDLRGRYGVTEVPAEFWSEWVRQQGEESDLLKNNIVFAADTQADLKARGKELAKETTGLEPIDPKKPGEKGGLRRIERAAESQQEELASS